ncbi:MAG: serpin family protein [Deltaproteobacteria bacterium]|nr:serpin family protein [Deltaproteobacteria bacterium]
MRTMTAAVYLSASLALGCGSNGPGPVDVRELTEVEQSLVQASNRFGFKLLHEVIAESDGGNVFISPLSVSIALGMTFNGTGGSTEQGMRAALEYGDLSLEEIDQGYRSLIELLVGLDPEVQMEIANSIWYRLGFDVLQTFIDAMLEFFDALVTAVDFTDPGTVNAINAWVEEKTHGKIDTILDRTSADTVMVLINAIYFKGTWTYQFDPEDSSDGTFHTGAGGDKSVKMMHLHGDLRYQRCEDFQAVDLAYGNGLYSMSIFLPADGKTVDDLVAQLDDETWTEWMAGFEEQELELAMPRFELEYDKTLNEVLIALGMEDAFTPYVADFSGIKPDHDMWISLVKHKTYVKVNEEGTEAAAVTAVVIEDGAVGDVMIVDRPFLFVIHDAHSRAMLFMGKIVDPPSE